MKFNDKQVIKICITGGPCAGKTTSLAKIVETFTSKFTVYTVPEMATLTFSSGVTIIPLLFTEEDSRRFNTSIIQAQIDMERYFENLAMTQRKKVIMITDRGCCDNFAYTSEENKTKILDSQGWSMNFLCNDRYDMVIHLVTAAVGAEEFYSRENNLARSELKEQAIEVDMKTQKQWLGHRNLVIIDNSQKGFEKKINRVLDVISDLVGVKTQHRIVRKYLMDPSFTLERIPKEIKYDRYTEIQTFLLTNKLKTQNFVIKRIYSDSIYPIYVFVSRTIEEKYEKRIETHRNLTEKAYLDFIASQKDPNFDNTKRSVITFSYNIENEFNMYNIEKITTENESCVVFKVIRDQEHEIQEFIPTFIKVTEDITENPKYFSMNFSRHDYINEKFPHPTLSMTDEFPETIARKNSTLNKGH